MRGSVNTSTGEFGLYGYQWIEKPVTYGFVSHMDTLNADGALIGRVNGKVCLIKGFKIVNACANR